VTPSHLGIVVLCHGLDDAAWRNWAVRLIASFPHAARRSLRDERELPEIVSLLVLEEAAQIASARHMPGFMALLIGDHFRDASDRPAARHTASSRDTGSRTSSRIFPGSSLTTSDNGSSSRTASTLGAKVPKAGTQCS
jgi:hypothetical protein